MSAVAPVFNNLPQPVSAEQPQAMEKYDQGFGCILYRTKIPVGDAATLEAAAIKDFGYVYLDGKRIGIPDRRSGSAKLALPAREKEAQLDILMEPMGRVNFGPEMKDPKGLIAPVRLGDQVLKGWQVFNLPLDEPMMSGLRFIKQSSPWRIAPAFWRATVNIEKPGDTFLDLRGWGKGVVWVNGICLARFWNIGPSQTAYLPGCWLRKGKNEIVILDYLRSDSVAPAHTGTFAPGGDTQEIKFAAPVTGKFFCLESLKAFDGKPYAAIAELDLIDANGSAISHNGWTIAYVDSEERAGEDGSAENAIDGQTANFWHTEWKNAAPAHPHRLILNLGKPQTISGFRYVPRQGGGGGWIKDYRVLVGDGLVAPK